MSEVTLNSMPPLVTTASHRDSAGRPADPSSAPSGKSLPVKATAAPVAATSTSGVQETREIDNEVKEDERAMLEQAVADLNEHQLANRKLQFSLDEEAGRPVVSVVDQDTDEVIRQIPSELMLELARKLNDEEPLSLFSAHV